MAIQFFAPKILGSLFIGVGALSGGGVIYWYQMPTTWRELLVKEGFLFLSSEDDYKGMFNDQKEDTDWKKENDLKDSEESNVNDKATKYCKEKLDATLPNSSSGDYASTKKKLIAFCTFDGIKTVKARLIQSKKSGWVGNSDDNKRKAIFAVYRYEPRFIEWLKEDDPSQNGSLSSSSTVEIGHSKLKTACENLLKKNYGEVSEDHIKYGSWWCVELGYSTIKDKIQKDDSGWTVRSQDDSEWSALKEKWKNTAVVKKWANKAKSQEESQELSEDSLKKLCEESNVNSKLSDEESYQEKYLVIKSVCKGGSGS